MGADPVNLEQQIRELQALARSMDKAWIDIQIEAMELEFIGDSE